MYTCEFKSIAGVPSGWELDSHPSTAHYLYAFSTFREGYNVTASLTKKRKPVATRACEQTKNIPKCWFNKTKQRTHTVTSVLRTTRIRFQLLGRVSGGYNTKQKVTCNKRTWRKKERKVKRPFNKNVKTHVKKERKGAHHPLGPMIKLNICQPRKKARKIASRIPGRVARERPLGCAWTNIYFKQCLMVLTHRDAGRPECDAKTGLALYCSGLHVHLPRNVCPELTGTLYQIYHESSRSGRRARHHNGTVFHEGVKHKWDFFLRNHPLFGPEGESLPRTLRIQNVQKWKTKKVHHCCIIYFPRITGQNLLLLINELMNWLIH